MAELYVGGKWTGTRDGGRREIRCPADGRVVAEVDEATAPDVAAAVEAAREAFDAGEWSSSSTLERGRLLHRVADLPAYTHRTITSRDDLLRELETVRDQGYAVAADELEVGLTAVAAPVRSAHGDVIASISLSGQTFRLPEARVEELVPVVVAAGAEVSRRLGWDS